VEEGGGVLEDVVDVAEHGGQVLAGEDRPQAVKLCLQRGKVVLLHGLQAAVV
jgi:hypothetical protein